MILEGYVSVIPCFFLQALAHRKSRGEEAGAQINTLNVLCPGSARYSFGSKLLTPYGGDVKSGGSRPLLPSYRK